MAKAVSIKQWLTLSAVGAALLLLPRRSSRRDTLPQDLSNNHAADDHAVEINGTDEKAADIVDNTAPDHNNAADDNNIVDDNAADDTSVKHKRVRSDAP